VFWVDEIIEEIIRKLPKEHYLICDWTTPSGHAHIGSLRGVVIHALVRQGLSEKKKKALFQYGFDDFDPMDGLPSYIDASWKKYMGMPLFLVPAPDGKSKNFAEQYLNEFCQVFRGLGIKPKIVKTSELYAQGRFDKAIKIVLDNASTIRKIYKKVSGSDKSFDWHPVQVVCPKCGKIGTTKVISWDGQKVKFECQKDLVEWAEGCGYQGKISPFGGNAKMPWKVEWPAKWDLFDTDIEGEGKDHFAAGGSRDVADEIYRQVFGKKPPFDIRYEHFLVAGAKMSSSKGLGATAKDMVDFLPANILKFLFVKTKAKRTIDFQPDGDTIPILYDEFDKALMEFQKDPKAPLSRSYYFSEIGEQKKMPKYLLRFSKAAFMLQMPRIDIYQYAEKEKGAKLTGIERDEIDCRIRVAREWLEKFAPDKYKFTIYSDLPPSAKNLSQNQKQFLAGVLKLMEEQKWSGEELHSKIHELKNQMKLEPREAFSAIYLIFTGKDSGPQAGWFLASLDRDMVIKRLKEAV